MGALFAATVILLINTVLGGSSTRPCTAQTQHCFYDPCLWQNCEKYPAAECRDYRCGDICEKEFWYNGVNVTDECSAGKTDIFTSLFNSITGVADNTNSGNSVGNSGTGGTGTGSNTVNGGTGGSQTSSACPPGVSEVACFMEPCSVSSCPRIPSATCRNNYCGGCIADYYQGQEKVTDKCSADNLCPNGQLPVSCAGSPCSTAKCPRYPSATCKENSCGGCNAQFFNGNEEVTSKCKVDSHGCPPQKPYTQCSYSPCRVSSCWRYPGAVCIDVKCGGCYAKFYYQEQEVTASCRPQPQRRRMPPWYYWMMGDGAF